MSSALFMPKAQGSPRKQKVEISNVGDQFCAFFSSHRYPDVRSGPFSGVQRLPTEFCIPCWDSLSDDCEAVRISSMSRGATVKRNASGGSQALARTLRYRDLWPDQTWFTWIELQSPAPRSSGRRSGSRSLSFGRASSMTRSPPAVTSRGPIHFR